LADCGFGSADCGLERAGREETGATGTTEDTEHTERGRMHGVQEIDEGTAKTPRKGKSTTANGKRRTRAWEYGWHRQ
jgi:hypothetical protein